MPNCDNITDISYFWKLIRQFEGIILNNRCDFVIRIDDPQELIGFTRFVFLFYQIFAMSRTIDEVRDEGKFPIIASLADTWIGLSDYNEMHLGILLMTLFEYFVRII